MRRRRFGLTVLMVAAALTPTSRAQSPDSADTTGRVTPDGPYRSQMRIIEPGVKPAVTAPRRDAFGLALAGRAQGYLAAREGDVDAAIGHLQSALATGALAPLAEAQLTRDLLVLMAGRGDEAFAQTYLDATAQGTALDAEIAAAAAAALARLERFEAALAAVNAALANAPKSQSGSQDVRRLKVVILARLARFSDAAALAAQQLDLTETSSLRWRELIDLYRAGGDAERAVAVAELGVVHGALNSLSDRRFVAQLYVTSGLPDHAAVMLAETLGDLATTSPDDVERVAAMDLLLAAQRRAAAWADAYRTAGVLTRIAPSSARWEARGALAMRQGAADVAADAFASALRNVPAARRGRVLMALGEAHVARGDRRAARRAFEQASELGGVYRAAGLALAALSDEQAATPAQSGDPDSTGPASPVTAQDDPGGPPGVSGESANERAELNRRRIPRTRLYFADAEADAAALPDTVARLASRVARSLRRERLVAAGPLRIRVADAGALAAGGAVTVQVGVPVRSSVPPRGGLRNVSLPPIDAAVRQIDGDAASLAAAWTGLVEDVVAAGLEPGDDARTVILATDDAGQPRRFELQLAVRTP